MPDDPSPSSPSSTPATPPLQAVPLGVATVLAFEAYFLALSLGTAYALWTIWPFSGAGDVRLFGFPVALGEDPEARLLLVAMFSGILGALVHVITSFTFYLGLRKDDRAWVPWYALRPVVGMTLGLIFYLILRAGLVTSDGADAVNPFGVAAVSSLAGLFSKQTVEKLRDVFENAFPVRPPTPDRDKPAESAEPQRPPSGEGERARQQVD